MIIAERLTKDADFNLKGFPPMCEPSNMHERIIHRIQIARAGFFAGLFITVCPVFLTTASADDFGDKATVIFDGKTTKGWEGNAKWFRVQDGAVVAGTLKEKIPHNEFLCTEKEYGDFELRLEAKLTGQGTNAGIQFRSKRIPNDTELIGYQADIGTMKNRSIWGALYDESRRRKFLQDNAEASESATNKDDWNELRVVCKGPRIQIFVNGKQTVDYAEKDDGISQTGIIGLQIHSGPPTECWYRNIRIRSL